MTSVAAPRGSRAPRLAAFSGLVRRGGAVWVIVLALVLALTFARGTGFWNSGNIAAVLAGAAVLGLVALGQHVVVLGGGIDLSVGSMVTLTSLLTAVLVDGYPIRTVPVIVAMVVLGAAMGLLNGSLVSVARLPPFIVTLGMLYLVSGVALTVSATPAGRVTAALTDFSRATLGPVPAPFLVLVAAVAAVWLLLARTPWGRHLYAVGGDQHAARAAGVRVRPVLLGAYVTSGVLAGLAGVLLAARSAIGSPTAGSGLELSAITAVVIGGTSLLGGRGSLLGTVGGVALLALITNAITLLQLPSTWTDLVRGLIIIAAVAVFVVRRPR
ncbi:ABC transporter permease [Phycicoccus endophyticus]|uniref:ABC transporter permease n=1 Tax=Phycicoccus endophyticus TaxID=1690220 RepID=A0A7G9R212_9MICO|nr:ABC transporter permease [Phycicoccus endophyticus]NHI19728.1 ABC transporter permease [Phycicoccus endophyticus]QNN49637.1 ABC transporter permease [Phycicoccus endophyticus]GGL33518.1 ABC transporter permease [Phycicoccus endophyticus]